MTQGPEQFCYVIPSLGSAEHQHFAHIPGLIKELSKLTTVHVIVERGKPGLAVEGAAQVLIQRQADRSLFHRAIELLGFARALRRAGCRKFFVRISLPAALTLGLAAPFLGIQVYYWQSGDIKRTFPKWSARPWKRLSLELSVIPQYVALFLAHRFVTGPESMVDYYVGSYGVPRRKCIVLYNDLDLSAWRPCLNEMAAPAADRPIRLLFIGRLSPMKGGYHLAPIVRAIQRRGRKVQLRVIGEVHAEDIRRTLEATDIKDAVELLGPVPNRKLSEHFSWAQVAVLPSESEGFPRRALESMACGRPFVAFEAGGIRDIVPAEYLDYIIAPGDHEAFAAAVIRIAEDPRLAAALVAAGAKQVEKYATPNVARMLMERIITA